jgi:hypothetical protein
MVECGTQAVDVTTGVGVAQVGIVLLRRGVLRRTHRTNGRPRAGVIRIPELDQSEVDQHGLSIGADDHILGLDIPVDDAPTVAVRQGGQKLIGPSQHFPLGEHPLSLDTAGETLSLNVIHDQVHLAPLPEEVGHVHEVGVI